jgi:hypothetical protein
MANNMNNELVGYENGTSWTIDAGLAGWMGSGA